MSKIDKFLQKSRITEQEPVEVTITFKGEEYEFTFKKMTSAQFNGYMDLATVGDKINDEKLKNEIILNQVIDPNFNSADFNTIGARSGEDYIKNYLEPTITSQLSNAIIRESGITGASIKDRIDEAKN